MSRQFDEYMSDKFEVDGELHSLVSPSSLKELTEALNAKSLIEYQLSCLMHDEDSSGWESLLQEQQDLIDEFIDYLGNFDNRNLAINIAYLIQKYNMKVGDVESLLKISAGYISRTAKEGSGKKMSIDIAWKIAKLFEVSLQDIVETNMTQEKGNTGLLLQFLDKLINQTVDGDVEWEFLGGVTYELDDAIVRLGLITEENDTCVYHPDHLNEKMRWVLCDDIVTCKDFSGGADLVIIPFSQDGDSKVKYDFLLYYEASAHEPDGTWEKMFYTSDDPFNTLSDKAAVLYEKIRNTEFDAKVSPDIRSLIKGYLGEA